MDMDNEGVIKIEVTNNESGNNDKSADWDPSADKLLIETCAPDTIDSMTKIARLQEKIKDKGQLTTPIPLSMASLKPVSVHFPEAPSTAPQCVTEVSSSSANDSLHEGLRGKAIGEVILMSEANTQNRRYVGRGS